MAEYAAMNELLAYLTENCCRGDPSGCAVAFCDESIMTEATRRKRL
jgi:hypothetical protein